MRDMFFNEAKSQIMAETGISELHYASDGTYESEVKNKVREEMERQPISALKQMITHIFEAADADQDGYLDMNEYGVFR